MVKNIPIKFKRVAEAFDEVARWRPCESSSGSEYWPESGTDLSDLVNSFIQKGDGLEHFDIEIDCSNSDANWVSDNDDDNFMQRKEMLQGYLLNCVKDNKNYVKQKIMNEIEEALKLFSEHKNVASFTSRSGIKRNLMSHLRDKGFDAGLCKSRWEKTARFPAGTYEYIDLNVVNKRYIIELFLAEELEIIRPTSQYTTLLRMIPSILIIEKPQELKQIIRLMSAAMKDSLKHSDMHIAPWRRNGYLQARYFSPYKRTINRESGANSANMAREEGLAMKSSMLGFEADLLDLARSDNFGFKATGVLRVGLLAVALQGQ